MRRAISTSVAAVALVLCCVSLAQAQYTGRSRPFSAPLTQAIIRSPETSAPLTQAIIRSPEANCHVSRARLLARPGILLPTTCLQYPTGLRYMPSYNNYFYTPSYAYPASPGDRMAADAPLLNDDQSGATARRVHSRHNLEKSETLIARGDAQFAKQQYVAAITRYREAARVAPNASEARLRHGLALVAARKYPAAARAFHEALALRADWSDSKLHLQKLYAPGELAAATAALTRLAQSDPMNADLALALGMQLFFSGQRDKAETYFNRAIPLGAKLDDRLAGLLRKGEVAQAAP